MWWNRLGIVLIVVVVLVVVFFVVMGFIYPLLGGGP